MGKRLPEAATSDIVTLGQDKSEVGALALITYNPEKYAAEVYQPFADRLTVAINGVRTLDYDIKTTAGMAAAVTARATFRDLRVEAEKERKARKAPILSIGNLLESGYNNLEARITPIEEMFDFDIQRETKRKAEEKAEKERIEAARVADIRERIDSIRIQSAQAVGSTAAELRALLEQCAAREITKEEFAELAGEATLVLDAVGQELLAMFNKAKASEAADLAAEEARKAEAKRAADEAAAVAKQKAENERVANELAVAAKRLADQEAAQALVAKQLADKAAANLKAEQDALAEQVRLQWEAAAEQQRQLAAQQAEIEAQRAAFAREKEEAAARVEAAIKLEADHFDALLMDGEFNALLKERIERNHAEALEMNAQFDIDAAADLARCTETAKAMHTQGRSLVLPESCCARDARINEGFDETPTDGEILDVYVENFGGTREQAIERLALFDVVVARAEMVPA